MNLVDQSWRKCRKLGYSDDFDCRGSLLGIGTILNHRLKRPRMPEQYLRRHTSFTPIATREKSNDP